jgi:DNA processing protein
MQLSDEKLSWLRLSRSQNVGPRTFWQLISIYKTAANALEHLPALARKAGAKLLPVSMRDIDKEVAAVVEFGAEFIFPDSDIYPPLLQAVDDKPPLLVAKGRLDLLKTPDAIAVVGSRNCSTNGKMMAGFLAKELSAAGYAVVSGLARGIDAAAHKASLEKASFAVIAGGIDNIYPLENRDLYRGLYEKGVVLTEQPFGSVPLPKHFPTRNRVISGMSLGVVVVEAELRSGTLITARFALEQGREVFAVPGSPLDLRHSGTNSLIKSGAHLVATAEDVINELRNSQTISEQLFESVIDFSINQHDFSEQELEKLRQLLLEKMSYVPVSLENLASDCDIPLNILNILVVELELAGKAERLFGNKVVMCNHFMVNS